MRARYSATLFVATPIRSPCAARTVPSSVSSTYPYAAGPGLPRAPPSVERRAFTVDQRVQVERHLFIRVRGEQRAHDLGRALRRHDGLDAKLGGALLAATSPTVGSLPRRPMNVPVPAVYHEQRL